MVAIEDERLVRVARECDVVLVLAARIGDGVVAGTPVARAWPGRAGGDVDEDRLHQALDGGLVLRYERQASRDVVYSLRKIVDIVVRALSPGMNDPTTAVHGLSHASALLCDLLTGPGSARRHRDEQGQVRVIVPGWRPAELLHLSLEEPVQFASGQPAVLRRIAGLLREVAWRSPRGCLDDELLHYTRRIGEVAGDSTDLAAGEIARWREQVSAALAGRWPSEEA